MFKVSKIKDRENDVYTVSVSYLNQKVTFKTLKKDFKLKYFVNGKPWMQNLDNLETVEKEDNNNKNISVFFWSNN